MASWHEGRHECWRPRTAIYVAKRAAGNLIEGTVEGRGGEREDNSNTEP